MINRREFMIGASAAMLSMSDLHDRERPAAGSPGRNIRQKSARVTLVCTSDRAHGVKTAIDLLGVNPVKGKQVLIKPNFNTADPYPGSTHNDTLVNLIGHLKRMGASSLMIGERSGPPATTEVIKGKGVVGICREHNVGLINFEDLPPGQWVRIRPEQIHWNNGFDVAKPVLDAECVVSTCCLKTHGYGGVFTMSLKLSVGVTHKRNMTELHSSFRSMRKMIAEINQAYSPSLILLDAVEAFVDGGPMTGKRKRADLILAGTDRIAIDAVGLAVLKDLGSNEAIMGRKIFEQEQISRAVELGLGVSRPEDIEIVAGDNKGRAYAEKLKGMLLRG
ncbi:MAG: DUF362 domain-containing protein [Nitrospiraceae bacterium]|nr:DUF362 domain-containing protein [Nitrospiraceae bacterium]